MIRLVALLASVLVATGCAATRFSLPAVGPSEGQRYPGSIIWHDLLSDTPEQTRQFYGELFGWRFEQVPGVNYQLIRNGDRLIGGMVDQNRLSNPLDVSQWVVSMSVADIDAAALQVDAAGGQVLTPPTSLGERGRISVVLDNSGALLALLQTAAGDPPDYPYGGTGAPDNRPGGPDNRSSGDFLWNELWVAEPGSAARFYGDLVSLSVESLELDGKAAGPIEYLLLLDGERPRAGIRTMPAADFPPAWVSYLRVADLRELNQVLSRVEPLGGRVLMPATARPGGGSVAIIAGPSGAGVALQTWPLETPEKPGDTS